MTLIAGFASSISFPVAHALVEHYSWQFAVRAFALVVLLVGVPLIGWSSYKIESSD